MKRTIAALGLIGLLGGCDKAQTWVKDECTKGDLTFKAEYVSVLADPDQCNLLIYHGNDKVGSVYKVGKAKPDFKCDNGQVFNSEECTFSYKSQ